VILQYKAILRRINKVGVKANLAAVTTIAKSKLQGSLTTHKDLNSFYKTLEVKRSQRIIFNQRRTTVVYIISISITRYFLSSTHHPRTNFYNKFLSSKILTKNPLTDLFPNI